MAAKRTRYQHRVTKFIYVSGAYVIGGIIAVVAFDLGRLGALIILTGTVIFYCIAALADAVYDSLNERINIQSSWLAYRLDAIEFRAPQQNLWVTRGSGSAPSASYRAISMAL